MKQESSKAAPVHPLERNREAREYFERINRHMSRNSSGAWRSAVRACTGSLPTWAEPKPKGRRRKQETGEAA